tara:strand:+ start:363 stop:644 length:282 start_codon:yes stop_codon:yes gene_type:complete
MSFVDVSLSIVIALKVSDKTLCKYLFSTTEEISASVKIKENIVAKLGAIIPEPLAMPDILTTLSPIFISEDATLGLVSVVIIAEAIFIQISLF